MPFDDLIKVPFSEVREKADALLASTYNKLEREWPKRLANEHFAREFLLTTVKLSEVTYQSVRYLCAEKPPDSARKPGFVTAGPMLARGVLDSLASVVFMFEDLPGRSRWFLKSAWRNRHEELVLCRATHSADPDFAPYIVELDKVTTILAGRAAVSAAEAADPTLVPWWPNLGKRMLRQVKDPERSTFLEYLNTWYYGGLSAASHSTGSGLMERAAVLLEADEAKRDAIVSHYRQMNVVWTLAFVLGILSEIEIELRFGLQDRLSYLWTFAAASAYAIRDMHRRRYKAKLA